METPIEVQKELFVESTSVTSAPSPKKNHLTYLLVPLE